MCPALPALDRYTALGLPGEAVDHGKPRARALADVLGREERIENPRRHRVRHAGAAVGDRDLDIVARRQVGLVRRQAKIGERDVQRAALGHGIAGVVGEVEDRLFQLAWTDVAVPEIRRAGNARLDVLAQRAAQHVDEAGRQPAGMHRLAPVGPAPRKAEQPFGERGAAPPAASAG